ncbi:MAG: hypothetical protein B7Y03_02400 [Polaromonas sp. 24-62-144]|jgi:hypothetical protein|nr:MAG: hypothetical protein B7Y03_02400 [Polaromonas sp. 24-62-144]
MNLFKEEIEQLGVGLEKAVTLAGKQLNDTVTQISAEIHEQRKLTKDDIEGLVNYAALKFGETLDSRIEKLRLEASTLVSQKISQVRTELTEAANEQKRVAVRNAAVAVCASLMVGMVSLFYRKYLHGDIDLLDVFRSSMLAMAVGYTLWLLFKHVGAYLQSSRFKRNAVIAGLGYFDVLRPKGAVGQVFILGLIVAIWALTTFSSTIQALVGR